MVWRVLEVIFPAGASVGYFGKLWAFPLQRNRGAIRRNADNAGIPKGTLVGMIIVGLRCWEGEEPYYLDHWR